MGKQISTRLDNDFQRTFTTCDNEFDDEINAQNHNATHDCQLTDVYFDFFASHINRTDDAQRQISLNSLCVLS